MRSIKTGLVFTSMLFLVPMTLWSQESASQGSFEVKEFIYEAAPFPSCHASTIVDLPDGTLLAAWFGGKDEGDDSVEIWVSRKPEGGVWTAPEALTDYPDIPLWNPVLYRDGDRVWLFFKIGPSPREWIGAYRISEDRGQTWGEVFYMPAGLIGPVRSKPIRLDDGSILAGTSVEAGYRGNTPRDAPYRSWAAWVNRSTDGGETWSIHGPITVPGENYGVIQPTLWQTENGDVKMLLRATDRIGAICESVSRDGGITWSPARPITLPNPNSGVDAVKLHDGRVVLIYNHTERGRSPIHLAVSHDDGETWGEPMIIEEGEGEYSYPAVIQAEDGNIHITYTWKRERIRHIEIDPTNLPD